VVGVKGKIQTFLVRVAGTNPELCAAGACKGLGGGQGGGMLHSLDSVSWSLSTGC
jgi:hypothetical protein